MPSQVPGAGTDTIEESPGRGNKGNRVVSTVVRNVTLLKAKIASVVNMVVMLAVAKGERT